MVYDVKFVKLRAQPTAKAKMHHIFEKKERQGSGLSPCIFTMPVDFAMKVADLACEELGMMGSEDEDKRGAYAYIYEGKGICEGRWSGDVGMDSADKMESRVGHLGVE